MRIRFVPRDRDDELLRWIEQRCAGVSLTRIAADSGIFPEAIRVATLKVMEADLEESGEDKNAVRRRYWRS